MFKSFLVMMVLSTAALAQEKAQKTVVLIHGAFADGSSWDKVIPLLQAKGLKVVAVQNPLTSLTDDVAAAKRVIAEQSGPVILVGHSWGGTVITEAAATPKLPRWSTWPRSRRTPASHQATSGKVAHLLRDRPASAPTARVFSI